MSDWLAHIIIFNPIILLLFFLLVSFYSVYLFIQFLPSSSGELQRTECLRSLREIAIPLAERPARGDLTGEVCHWADGYQFNVRLYEKLLLSVFDMLDEGKLTEVGVDLPKTIIIL